VPVTRTVTSVVTTTSPPPPAPLVATMTIDQTPQVSNYVRRTETTRNGEYVEQQTTDPVVPAVTTIQSTTTRSTSETIPPR
jgi:hypothetical protein